MKRSSGPRRTANLSESIHQQLNMYTLAAKASGVSLLVLAHPVEAKIIYTPAHIPIIENGPAVKLDLNHDGVLDFTLYNLCNCGSDSYAFLAITGNQIRNAVWETRTQFQWWPAALKAGVRLGSNTAFRTAATAPYMCVVVSTRSSGFWAGSHNAYLGLRFQINGKSHYGWARFTVKTYDRKPPVIKATLTGYAYETVPNKPIITGRTKGPSAPRSNNRVPLSPHPSRKPGSLGLLAMGAPGLSIWRRKESALEGN